MTATPEGRPPREHFFSGRHVRGWVASANIATALALTAQYLWVTNHLIEVGDDERLLQLQPSGWIFVLLPLGGVIASKRISEFALELGHTALIKLHVINHATPKELPGSASKPPVIPPPDGWLWESSSQQDQGEKDEPPEK